MAERKAVEIQIGNPDAFQKTIDSFLRELGVDVSGALDDAITEVGKEAVEKLRETSPRDKGNYAKAWKFKKNAKGQSGALEAKVYNDRGNLTHILEFGHVKLSGDTVIGTVKGQPHIEPVNDWVQREIPQRFTQKMKK